jgi:phage gp45-like
MVTRTTLRNASQRAQSYASRATLRELNSKPQWAEAKHIDVFPGETATDVEYAENYGGTSVPAKQDEEEEEQKGKQQQQQSGDGGKGTPGEENEQPKGDAAEAIVLYLNGSRSHPVIISVGDRRHRLLELEEGDVAQHRLKDDRQQMLYSKDGTYISTRNDKTMRIALVPQEQEQQQQASPQQQASAQQQLSPQQQADAGGGDTSSSSGGKQQKKKKTYGQKSAKDDNKKSDTFIEQTKDHNHIRRGNGNVIAKDASTLTYHSDENKQSTKCDGAHTHIRATGAKIWVAPGACLATSPIEIADCGCGGAKKTYGVKGDTSTPPAPGASSMSLAPSLLTTEQNAQAPSRMRFWIVRHLNSFGVDNCHVDDMDFTALAEGIETVEWKEGMGEIEYDDRPRLREIITDVGLFAPFFDQFIAKLPYITLAQAKKIKCDLISLLYNNKRQLPYARNVAAGNFTWDATDQSVLAMSSATIPALLGGTAGSGNSLVTQINSQNADLVNQINSQNANEVTQVNAQNSSVVTGVNGVVNGINANIVPSAGVLSNQINANVVNTTNNGFSNIDANMGTINGDVGVYNGFIDYFNTYIMGSVGDGQNTLNNRLQAATLSVTGGNTVTAAGGLTGGLSGTASAFSAVGTNPYRLSSVAVSSSNVGGITADPIAASPITASPIAPGSGPGAATVQWTPIGQANPVTVTVTEMSDIMSGIHSRRLALTTTKFNKTAAVNALSTIAAVIAYNVTTGWP